MMAKTRFQRFLHALGFEAVAILLCTPLFAWAMGTSWLEMGALTVANCLLALGWNMAFNAWFDRWLLRRERRKTLRVRVAHALLFEGGLVLLSVPLAAWWLDLGLLAAFLLDAALLLFFLPYTYVYHWASDALWTAWTARRDRSTAGG